jgi:phage-related protein
MSSAIFANGQSVNRELIDRLRGANWETRSTMGARIARNLFAVRNAQLVLLHSFIKKTQRTPSPDIDFAEKRLKERPHEEN